MWYVLYSLLLGAACFLTGLKLMFDAGADGDINPWTLGPLLVFCLLATNALYLLPHYLGYKAARSIEERQFLNIKVALASLAIPICVAIWLLPPGSGLYIGAILAGMPIGLLAGCFPHAP